MAPLATAAPNAPATLAAALEPRPPDNGRRREKERTGLLPAPIRLRKDRAAIKTAYIYRRAQERGLVRGRTMRAILGAAIYIVQREMGI
jgi:hypothetical protein